MTRLLDDTCTAVQEIRMTGELNATVRCVCHRIVAFAERVLH
jgi:hypothetical protein